MPPPTRPWLPPWLAGYDWRVARQDLVAGLIVVMMLVPQSLAYALLAGLPAEAGLFASALPLVAYACFGSSRALAVGPVAVVSLMTASALSGLAEPGTAAHMALALQLAALAGAMLMLAGTLRLGFLSHLLSHPVINGFMTGSAVLIILGQLMPLIGVRGSGHSALELAQALLEKASGFNPATALMGGTALAILLLGRRVLEPLGQLLHLPQASVELLLKLLPMFVVMAAIALNFALGLDHAHGIAVVGPVPSALPGLSLPTFDAGPLRALLLPAAAIALVGFIESVSVAQSLAMRERESINANRELLGLGAANLTAAFSGGLPVTGGLSRSIVNHAAGARSPLAGVVAAGALIALLYSVSGLFARLPTCVLAASIIVPMLGLVNLRNLLATWRYSRADGMAQLATTLGVLGMGVEPGIAIGVVLSLLALIWAASQPHIAVVGRVPGSEQYRNVERAEVEIDPAVLALRADENLFFGNIAAVEKALEMALAARTSVRHVVLVLSSVNLIDATALERLELLEESLRARGVSLSLAGVKGPVLDRLQGTRLLSCLDGRVFRFTHEAFKHLAGKDASASP